MSTAWWLGEMNENYEAEVDEIRYKSRKTSQGKKSRKKDLKKYLLAVSAAAVFMNAWSRRTQTAWSAGDQTGMKTELVSLVRPGTLEGRISRHSGDQRGNLRTEFFRN